MRDVSPEPAVECLREGARFVARLSGPWSVEHGQRIEELVTGLPAGLGEARNAFVDLSAVTRLDTLGALVVNRLLRDAGSDGLRLDIVNAKAEHLTLLEEVRHATVERPGVRREENTLFDLVVDMGEAVVDFGRNLWSGTVFFGEVIIAVGRSFLHPRRFRGPSLVNQMELVALRGAPIIILISFLVGAIVAQQGIFQLRRFSAEPFVVNMAGILSLRELGLLLAAIMVAGRSGSAFTAELGSMKMREEIDALRVMGLDPMAVLVAPRILALVLTMPLLAFIASMSAVFGSGLVSWTYGSITPEVFIDRLREAIDGGDIAVGLIKAPFMALMIGLIACQEGLNVAGSAESLGRRVTSSVVKSIFMVIVVDGLFAMFFAAIKL